MPLEYIPSNTECIPSPVLESFLALQIACSELIYLPPILYRQKCCGSTFPHRKNKTGHHQCILSCNSYVCLSARAMPLEYIPSNTECIPSPVLESFLALQIACSELIYLPPILYRQKCCGSTFQHRKATNWPPPVHSFVQFLRMPFSSSYAIQIHPQQH